MKLSDEELKIIEQRRANLRRKRGTVECYSCDGTGSYSQCNCAVCHGNGELKRNGPEVQKRVKELQSEKRHSAACFDVKIKYVQGKR